MSTIRNEHTGQVKFSSRHAQNEIGRNLNERIFLLMQTSGWNLKGQFFIAEYHLRENLSKLTAAFNDN